MKRTPRASVRPREPCSDNEDRVIDFSSASLYLCAFQAILATCCCAAASIVLVWAFPENVSAVRTLACCLGVGTVLSYAPLRIGRAHGARFLFTSLRPVVFVYMSGLVLEQLLHTCVSDPTTSPSVRTAIFHVSMLVLAIGGFVRSFAPLNDTDGPFVLSLVALSVIAAIPPPAVALAGPLCQSVSAWTAAERMLRAFCFSTAYAVHVYACTSSRTTCLPSLSSTSIVVTRATSATVWTLGAHPWILPLSILQNALAIWQRVKKQKDTSCGYRILHAVTTDDDDSGDELPETTEKLETPATLAPKEKPEEEEIRDPRQKLKSLLSAPPSYILEPHDLQELTGESASPESLPTHAQMHDAERDEPAPPEEREEHTSTCRAPVVAALAPKRGFRLEPTVAGEQPAPAPAQGVVHGSEAHLKAVAARLVAE